MPAAHLHGQARICGASTVVVGQSSCFVNGQLWAVINDPNSHGEGGLIPSGIGVFIEGKPVIVHAPDPAQPDLLCPLVPHCGPDTAAGSGDTFAYGR